MLTEDAQGAAVKSYSFIKLDAYIGNRQKWSLLLQWESYR